jgi:large subunit ribosomal protein L23
MTTIFEILRRPLVTEKTNYLVNDLHQYVFEVAGFATRSMIRDAVQTLFNVKVVRVNVINAPAKRTRRAKSRRLLIRSSGYKKAIITLAPDNRIPIFEGVE